MNIDNNAKKVSQITDLELKMMKNLSAYALPNSPVNSGMKAPQVKPKFYDFALGPSTSLYTIIVRTINEINEIFESYKANFDETKSHIETVSGNPHKVTAEETGAYTKEATDNLLEQLEYEFATGLAEIISGKQVVGNAKNTENVTTKIAGVDLKNIFLMDGTYAYENGGRPTVHFALSDSDGNPINQTYLKKSDANLDWLYIADALNVDGDAYFHSGINLNGGAIVLDGNRNDTRITVNGEEIAFLNEIIDGFIVAKKAERDSDGNRINDTYVKVNQKGVANGVATLDGNCKIPSSQLPSYVDDVLEYSSINEFPTTGESGKIYLETSTNKSYRWSGSQYAEISSSLALGETSATAYAGDKGKKNAEDIVEIKETLPTLQPKLTAGNGISISADGTISLSLPNGDEVSY